MQKKVVKFIKQTKELKFAVEPNYEQLIEILNEKEVIVAIEDAPKGFIERIVIEMEEFSEYTFPAI